MPTVELNGHPGADGLGTGAETIAESLTSSEGSSGCEIVGLAELVPSTTSELKSAVLVRGVSLLVKLGVVGEVVPGEGSLAGGDVPACSPLLLVDPAFMESLDGP